MNEPAAHASDDFGSLTPAAKRAVIGNIGNGMTTFSQKDSQTIRGVKLRKLSPAFFRMETPVAKDVGQWTTSASVKRMRPSVAAATP